MQNAKCKVSGLRRKFIFYCTDFNTVGDDAHIVPYENFIKPFGRAQRPSPTIHQLLFVGKTLAVFRETNINIVGLGVYDKPLICIFFGTSETAVPYDD